LRKGRETELSEYRDRQILSSEEHSLRTIACAAGVVLVTFAGILIWIIRIV
jgi:hypothetical protein